MIPIDGLSFSDMIKQLQTIKNQLEKTSNESSIIILRHGIVFAEMIMACISLVDNLRMIERDLRQS